MESKGNLNYFSERKLWNRACTYVYTSIMQGNPYSVSNTQGSLFYACVINNIQTVFKWRNGRYA